MNIRKLSQGILGLDRMGEERNRFEKFIKMHLYPKSAQAHMPYFEWF
jgi:hypothetical protein